MKKSMSTAAALLLALLTVVGLAPSASAYPDPTFEVSVDTQRVVGGRNFTARVSTGSSGVKCDWTLIWNGVTHTSASASTEDRATFRTPKVKKKKDIELTARCVYQTTSTPQRAAATQTWQGTVMITVLPTSTTNGAAAAGDESLPSTGGPNTWFLVAGVAMLVAGVGAVLVARRRADDRDAFTGQA